MRRRPDRLTAWALAGALWAVFGSAGLSGCASTPAPRPGQDWRTPPDFAVGVRVSGERVATDPTRRTAFWLLGPDRKLRVQRPRTSGGLRESWRVSYGKVDAIYRFIRLNHLMAEPTTPEAERMLAGRTRGGVLYDVTITAYGRTHRYHTTPRESPPTIRLLTRLVRVGPESEGG